MVADAVPIRDAATVILLRDGRNGIEAFMLRRREDLAFSPGAYVFPGGAVDPDDGDVASLCAGRDDAGASAVLGLPDGGLRFWVAAVRECFEETGVLLARRDDGRPLDPARLCGHGHDTFAGICTAHGVRLDLASLHYFAHWLTPVPSPRRYDTRFFVAALPVDQHPLHDSGEAVDGLWVRPADALARWPGDYELIRPTRESLRALARFASIGEVLAATAAMERVPHAQPRMGPSGEGVRVLLPGDTGWDAAAGV